MKVLVEIIVVFCLYCFMPAAEAANYTLPLSLTGYSEDLIVKGANTETTVFFPLPKAPIGKDSSINLFLEPSPYLNNGSTFSVFLNDKAAVNLTAGQLRRNSWVKLPIPPEATAQRGITVSIRTGMFGSDKNLCTDYRRGYLFYTLKNNSNVLMNVTPPAPKTVPDFFAALYQGLVIVLPPNPTKEEITAGIWLYGALQKAYPYQVVRLSVGAPQGMVPNFPEVWVGEREHLPQNLRGSAGNLALPFPNKLVVTGSDGGDLLQVARQLMTMPVYAALPAAQSSIQLSSQENEDLPERISFANNGALSGITNISMDFPLYPGQLKVLPQSLGIHLEGRYSPSAFAGNPAKLDVYLNRSLIYSMVLDDTGILDRDINLPDEFRLKACNDLSVKISYPETEDTCAVMGPGETAQILPSSYFVGIGSLKRDKMTWDSAGILFGRSGLVLIDDNPSTEVIKGAAQAIRLLDSQLPPGKFAFPSVGYLSEYTKTLTADYIIAVSGAELPQELAQGLPIKLGADSTVYQSNGQNAQITFQAGGDAVVGQLGNYKGVPLVAFQGVHTPQKLSGAIYALIKALDKGGASGNLYVYDDKPSFFSTLSPASPEKSGSLRFLSVPWNLWEQAYRYAGNSYKLLFMAMIILVMIVTCQWFFYRRKK